ncbi:YceI family protein [Reyranella soli]|uniref:Polyisoprenoid-binding protein n=1 Tax=Reyranella soli TaxID=1230389 RepID=A0A512N566_9HYPH|nr:YceI family protein [Reyranella soli]GEP54106.1 polyisoprenoid-binding protein [Reyranella soli]
MRCWFALACLILLPLPSLAGPQDAWTVDPKASSLSFSVAQVGSIVSGRFPTWTGEIVLDPASLASARIDIKIDTRPASTNNRDVDSLMKGPNFLDVQKFPEARFVATSISGSGDRYEARGKLTIRDVTRDAILPFTLAITDDPAQPGRVRATARGRIILKRLDYGVGQNEWAATGQVANEVTVDLNVVAGRSK